VGYEPSFLWLFSFYLSFSIVERVQICTGIGWRFLLRDKCTGIDVEVHVVGQVRKLNGDDDTGAPCTLQ
jgi:hypothetical protein